MLRAALWLVLLAGQDGVPAVPAEALPDYRNGLKAAEAKQWAAATSAFEKALALAPRHPLVLYNLGCASAGRGRPEAAIAWFKAYLAALPHAPNADAVSREVEALRKSSRERAEATFERIETIRRSLPAEACSHAAMWTAVAQFEARDYSGADRSLIWVRAQNDPLVEAFWSMQASTLARQGHYDRALLVLERLKIRKPEHLDRLYASYVGFFVDKRDAEGALHWLPRVKDSEEKETLKLTAARRFAGAELPDATLRFAETLKSEDARRGVLVLAAEELVRQNRLPSAEGLAEKAGPAGDAIRAAVAVGHARRRDFDPALAAAKRLGGAASSRVLGAISLELLHAGRADDARRTAAESVRIFEGLPAEEKDAMNERAVALAYACSGDGRRAERIAAAVGRGPFGGFPEDEQALGDVALVYTLQGDLDGAERCLQAEFALEESFKLGFSALAIGRAQLRAGRPDLAEATASRARCGVALRLLSELAERRLEQGDLEGAVRAAGKVPVTGKDGEWNGTGDGPLDGLLTRIRLAMRISDGAVEAKKPDLAAEVLRRVVREVVESRTAGEGAVSEALELVAFLQGRMGRRDDREETLRIVVSPELRDWIALAEKLSPVDPYRELAKPEERPIDAAWTAGGKLIVSARVASQALVRLNEIEDLEARFRIATPLEAQDFLDRAMTAYLNGRWEEALGYLAFHAEARPQAKAWTEPVMERIRRRKAAPVPGSLGRGLTLSALPEEARPLLQIAGEKGVSVAKVDGAAAKAGLQVFDVILSIDGKDATMTTADALLEAAPSVELTILRGRRTLTLRLEDPARALEAKTGDPAALEALRKQVDLAHQDLADARRKVRESPADADAASRLELRISAYRDLKARYEAQAGRPYRPPQD